MSLYGSIRKGKRKKGNEEDDKELKKKAHDDYGLDTESILDETKRSYKAAKVLDKEKKNIKRKREKAHSKELSKCMKEYDDKLKEIKGAVAIVNKTFEQIVKREPGRSKQLSESDAGYSGGIEQLDDEPSKRREQTHTAETSKVYREGQAVNKTRRPNHDEGDETAGKDFAFERLDNSPRTRRDSTEELERPITLLKREKEELQQNWQGERNAKDDSRKRIRQDQDKYQQEIKTLKSKCKAVEEAKQHAINSLQNEVDKVRQEKNHLSLRYEAEKKAMDDAITRLEQISITHVTIDVYNDLKQQKDSLNQALQEMKDEKADTEERIRQDQDKYQQEIKTLKSNYKAVEEAKEHTAKSLQNEVDSIRHENNNLSLRYEAEKKAKDDSITRLDEMSKASVSVDVFEKVHEENDSLKTELQRFQQESSEKISAKDGAIQRLQHDLEGIRHEWENFRQQLNAEKDEMNREFTLLKQKEEKLLDERDMLSDQFKTEQELKKDALRRLDQVNITHCPKETVDNLERQLISLTIERESLCRQLSDKQGTMDEALYRLQQEIDIDREQYEAKIESKNEAIRRLQQENETSMHERDNARKQYKAEKEAKDDAFNRLSLMASSKLRDNNPNITDLSDQNRPTKIAEKLSELYDNQWTDAFDALEQQDKGEREIIDMLLESLMTAFEECAKLANDNYFETVQRAIECRKQGPKSSPYRIVMSDQLMQEVKEFRKSQATKVWEDIKEIVFPKIHLSRYRSQDIESYISICIEISWLMAVQDPPLVLNIKAQRKFDAGTFKDYTKRGPLLEYVVWPALLLHESGPLLSKGVAQGCDLYPSYHEGDHSDRQRLSQSIGRFPNRDGDEKDDRKKMASTFSGFETGIHTENSQLENPPADDESL